MQNKIERIRNGHPYPGFYFQQTMLKLILQTQEGQQIEITVSPDDTFEDLQKQYENPENPGLPELLKHLITNGLDVDGKMKVFDYVTNSSTTEWLVEEPLDDITGLGTPDTLETIIKEIPMKECCVEYCPVTEIMAPNKVFFPLPSDKDRLSLWLRKIKRPDLFYSVLSAGPTEPKHFVCADHFAPHQFLKGTDQALKRRACPSLWPLRSEKQLIKKSSAINHQDEIIVKKELHDDVLQTNEDISVSDSIDPEYSMELFNVKEIVHPGALCRLCGEHVFSPVYIFSSEDSNTELSIADKINLCLPITVNVRDPLPKQLCKNCFDKLELCHKLSKKCLETEDKLKAMFELKKFQVKDVEEKQCPLCVSGNMQTVTKSGIYRKDKAGSIQETLKNSSARTRQVSPSRSVQGRISSLSLGDKKPLQEAKDVLSTTIVDETFEEANIPMGSQSHLLPDDLSCSICYRKENSIESMTEHAKQHEGYPCTICKDLSFKTMNEQQEHFLRHGVNNECCEICSVEWSKIKNVEEHIEHCKPEFWDVECAQCGEKFPHVQAGHDHRCHEPDEWFECDKCNKKFEAKSSLNMHLKTHDKSETLFYKCLSCNKEFTRKGSLHKHITTFHEDVESSLSPKCYKCKKCDEAFPTSAIAESHITEKHISQLIMAGMEFMSDQFTVEEINLTRVYICEYCERCFTIPSSLHEHRQIEHGDNSDYQCNICSKTFGSYKSLSRHKALHVKEYDLEELGIKLHYVCHYCNKSFLHFGTLKTHTTQHQQPLPYLCRLCNFKFATYEEVTDHRMNIHPYQTVLHERPTNFYDCKYCEKSFNNEVALVKHIRMHTGEKPYKCSVCEKGFSQTSGLYTHLKTHSDLRPYTCPVCPQAFKIKGDRDNHAKKHSGERPYKCEICNKAFMTQHVFSQHKKIHTNERPYKCDICGEAFRRSHVLTVHMRRHTGEKPHICDMCFKAYRQRGDLLKHKKMQHGIVPNNSNGAASNSSTDPTPSGDISSTESTTAFFTPLTS